MSCSNGEPLVIPQAGIEVEFEGIGKYRIPLLETLKDLDAAWADLAKDQAKTHYDLLALVVEKIRTLTGGQVVLSLDQADDLRMALYRAYREKKRRYLADMESSSPRSASSTDSGSEESETLD